METVERMFLLATVLLIGLASAQKVTRMSYCVIDEHHLRMDCKYEPAADSPEVFCKFTQNDRIVDTTDPEEMKDSLYKARAKIRLIDGNICQLRLNNLWEGKQNFTCNIRQQMETASKMAVVDKRTLATCSAGLLRFTGALLGLAALPSLLQISGLL